MATSSEFHAAIELTSDVSSNAKKKHTHTIGVCSPQLARADSSLALSDFAAAAAARPEKQKRARSVDEEALVIRRSVVASAATAAIVIVATQKKRAAQLLIDAAD